MVGLGQYGFIIHRATRLFVEEQQKVVLVLAAYIFIPGKLVTNLRLHSAGRLDLKDLFEGLCLL